MPPLSAFEHRRQDYAIRLYEWREGAGWAEKLALSLLFVGLAALAAQLRLFLPFSPVPLTGQVLVVLLTGFVLGRFGAVSMAMYLTLGSALGWFSGMVGLSALSGVTAGYLFGFVLAAGLIGEMAQRRREWSMARILGVMSMGVGVIYLLGSAWLCVLLGTSLWQALLIGALPFVAVDAVKVLVAATLAYSMTPRRA